MFFCSWVYRIMIHTTETGAFTAEVVDLASCMWGGNPSNPFMTGFSSAKIFAGRAGDFKPKTTTYHPRPRFHIDMALDQNSTTLQKRSESIPRVVG